MRVSFWPSGAPLMATVEAFDQMLRIIGFTPCVKRTPEKGFHKVALYASAGVPTHLSKLLPKGKWSSKLGKQEDIEHAINALDGPEYGSVYRVYSRPS